MENDVREDRDLRRREQHAVDTICCAMVGLHFNREETLEILKMLQAHCWFEPEIIPPQGPHDRTVTEIEQHRQEAYNKLKGLLALNIRKQG